MARVLLLSPYHGGSHRAFAEGLAARSRHEIESLTLPARFWKWRMRGAAMLLAHRARRLRGPFDALLASDMVNLAEFQGLAGTGRVPAVLYMHENQLSYPLPDNDRGDVGFGFVNLASALAARVTVFNSRFHRDAFFRALPTRLAAMPDCPLPAEPLERLRRHSRVLPVGCDLTGLGAGDPDVFHDRPAADGGPPVILWNHRWEFDKAPEVFFDALDRAEAAGLPFRLILAGECSQVHPKPFLKARERYGERILSYGWVPDRRVYGRLLQRADIVISTARQENFGVSVVEAVACGAWPLLPRRLSYPEVLPRRWHDECLYDEGELPARLQALLRAGPPARSRRRVLAEAMRVYDWSAVIGSYDDLLEGVASRWPANADLAP